MTGTCIALLLLALTGGMFLLAATNKENLGGFYKVISWTVIVLSMLCIICCLVCGGMSRCMMMQNCERGDECFEQKMEGGMHKRMMIMKSMHGDDMNECREHEGCEEMEMGCKGESMEGNCCKGEKMECHKGEGKMDCCKDGMKGMKKDSVVVKTK